MMTARGLRRVSSLHKLTAVIRRIAVSRLGQEAACHELINAHVLQRFGLVIVAALLRCLSKLVGCNEETTFDGNANWRQWQRRRHMHALRSALISVVPGLAASLRGRRHTQLTAFLVLRCPGSPNLLLCLSARNGGIELCSLALSREFDAGL
jgi:hypothetical protein